MTPWRRIEPAAGMKGWLYGTNFPSRLIRRAITVTEIERGGMVAYVQAGEWERRVFTHYLDCGREFQTASGEWIPESDDRVRRWLLKAIADLKAGGDKVCTGDSDEKARVRDDLEWVLWRNGWRVE